MSNIPMNNGAGGVVNEGAATAGSAEQEAVALKVEASVRPIEPRNNLLAFASIKIADCFVVDNIKVVALENGLKVDMPSIKGSGGKYHDIAFPVTAEFRKQVDAEVLEKFAAAIEKVHNIGDAQREYAEKPRIKEQLRAGAEMAAARDAAKPQQQDVAAKKPGVPGLE